VTINHPKKSTNLVSQHNKNIKLKINIKETIKETNENIEETYY
jgi:hypothetical protein